MGDLKDDIEKYLRGDMSPAEMHALEKRALSDPFLADAIEGASLLSTNELSADLVDLRGKISARQPKKVLPLWVWPARIAAGIAVVGLISYFAVVMNRENTDQHIAQNKVSRESDVKPLSPPVIDNKSDSVPSLPETPARTGGKPLPKAPIEKEVDHLGNAKLKEHSTEIAVEEREVAKSAVEDHGDEILTEAPAAQAGPVAGYSDAMTRLEESVVPRKLKVVTGTVVDAEDGRALPGVNVMIDGTTIGTTTDEEGRYVISTDSLNAGLQFSFIGYENKVVDAASGDMNVMLNPDISELSEVIVVGYGGTKREDPEGDPIVEMAEPAGGRKAYKQYLTENLRYPEQALNNQVEGRVTVQFTIDPSGKLSDFKVLRGLGYGCDEEVIRLIRQGPKWRPSRRNTEPVADKVKVRMKFNLPKK